MLTYSKMTPLQLRKRLHEVNEQIRSAIPQELLADAEIIQRFLDSKETEPSAVYADALNPWEAIKRCLELNGDFKLTKKEVIATIINGGYKKGDGAITDNNLVNDSINYHIRKKKLTYKGDALGRTAEGRLG